MAVPIIRNEQKETPSLSVLGNVLSIEGGNSVTLPSSLCLVISEEVITLTYTPTLVDSNKIKELNTPTTSVIETPTGAFTIGETISFQKTGLGDVEFNFIDEITGKFFKLTRQGAAATIRYTGTGWKFIGDYEEYTIITDPILALNPDGYWDFTDVPEADGVLFSTVINKGSVTGANMVPEGGPVVSVAALDGVKEASFDGIDSSFDIGGNTSFNYLPNSSFWLFVKKGEDAFSTDTFIFHKGDASSSITGVQYGLRTSSATTFSANVGGVASTGFIPSTVSNIIINSNGVTSEVYADGILVDTITNGVFVDALEPTTIGSRRGGTGKFYDGSIRKVATGTGTLTAQNITDLSAI